MSMNTGDRRTCPGCGNEFSGEMEFCPVCLLRKAVTGEVQSGESSTEDTAKPILEQAAQRFEHYEVVTGEDGKPGGVARWGLLTKPSTWTCAAR
jgi:hypothetical protein